MEDAKENSHEDFLNGSSKYQLLTTELNDLNIQKTRLEKLLNETVAESMVTILEEGTSNFVTLQTSRL